MIKKSPVKSILFIILAVLSMHAYAINLNINKAVAFVQDSVITTTVKAKIAANNNLPSDINVTTSNGVVMLAGTVNSDREQDQLVQLAQSTDGVKSVDTSKLSIKESVSSTDDIIITAKVKGLFLKEKLFGNVDVPAMDISVYTKNGIVYLSGTVANATQEKNAIELTKSVAGVKRVDSMIKIAK